jgi:hypothetical protein
MTNSAFTLNQKPFFGCEGTAATLMLEGISGPAGVGGTSPAI